MNTALRWTADINDMRGNKKKPKRTERQERWEQQQRQHWHTKARTELLCSLVLCFFFGYSCICDAAWPCPPARPSPPIYGLRRCLAHIQYRDCKRQPVTHRGACLWCLHNRFRNSGRAHLKSLWTHTHIHTQPYWSGLLMDGSIIVPALSDDWFSASLVHYLSRSAR